MLYPSASDRWFVRTGNPSVCLYYKEVEENGCDPSALDVVVALSPADALIMDKETAELLCNQLNKDKSCLLANGYTEFEILPLGR